jgi:hypothetical protein
MLDPTSSTPTSPVLARNARCDGERIYRAIGFFECFCQVDAMFTPLLRELSGEEPCGACLTIIHRMEHKKEECQGRSHFSDC